MANGSDPRQSRSTDDATTECLGRISAADTARSARRSQDCPTACDVAAPPRPSRVPRSLVPCDRGTLVNGPGTCSLRCAAGAGQSSWSHRGSRRRCSCIRSSTHHPCCGLPRGPCPDRLGRPCATLAASRHLRVRVTAPACAVAGD
jgi:hypothetical protein